jgi:putative tricarboxylic transport membrane protein
MKDAEEPMNIRPTYLITKACVVVLTGALVHAPVLAQAWKPTQAIEFISPSGAGSGADQVVRAIEQVLVGNKLLPVPMAVLNKPGAGGDIAWRWLSQNGAGGHHISLLTGNLLSNQITGRSTLNYTDLTCMAQLFSEASGIAVRTESSIKDGKDLLERLRKDPTSVTAAVGTAFGGSGHIALALAAKSVGSDPKKLKVVVFPGFAQALAALLGGHIDVVLNPASSLIPQMQEGKLRAIALSTPERVGGALAQVPTLHELGAKGVHIEAFRAIVGPKSMPANQVAYWEGVMKRMTETADWKKEVEHRGWMASFKVAKDCHSGIKVQHELMHEGLTALGLAKN